MQAFQNKKKAFIKMPLRVGIKNGFRQKS